MRRGPGTSLARATGLLTLGNAVNRVAGMVYRMVLSRFLGAEGLGLFQMAMSLYFAMLLPFIAGLPAALSRVVAGWRTEGISPHTRRLVVRVAAITLVLLLVGAAVVLALRWNPPGESWDLARTLVPFPLLMPAIAFAVVSATLRGVFLGQQQVLPVVSAQFTEQTARLTVLLAFLGSAGAGLAMAGRLEVVLGNLILGEAVGCAVLLWAYRRALARPWVVGRGDGSPPSLRAVFRLALPMGVQRAVWSMERLVEASLIPALLQRAGAGLHGAVAAYGELSGMVSPLIYMPNVFVHALAHTLIPGVAEVIDRPRTLHHRIRRALGLTADVGAVTSLVLAFAGGLLTHVLFGFAPEDAPYPHAGRLAELLAPLAALLYIDHVAAAVVRGLNRATEPMWVDFAALSVRLGLMVVLGQRLLWGVQAVVTALIASVALAAMLDLALVGRYSGLGFSVFAPVLRPLVSAAAGLAAGTVIRAALPPGAPAGATALAACGAALAVYTVVRVGAALSARDPDPD